MQKFADDSLADCFDPKSSLYLQIQANFFDKNRKLSYVHI